MKPRPAFTLLPGKMTVVEKTNDSGQLVEVGNFKERKKCKNFSSLCFLQVLFS